MNFEKFLNFLRTPPLAASKEDLRTAAFDETFIITLIHSKTNIWVQQNYNYDSFFKRSNEM